MVFLHVALLCDYCLRNSQAEINLQDGCIFLYETRGVPLAMVCLEAFPWPALLPVCHHCPPPLRGGALMISTSRLRGHG